MKTGIVIKTTGSWFYVKDNGDKNLYACKLKGKFRIEGRRTTNPVAVGDIVNFETLGKTNIITAIHPRKNYVIRKASNLSKESQIMAANVDLAAIMVTINYPLTLTAFIDRFLVSAQAYGIPAVILFNKIDLYNNDNDKQILQEYIRTYEIAGYQYFLLSVQKKKGLEAVKKLLTHKITVLAGHSGVGKTTLINQLNPKLQLKVQNISEYHQAGKHTTTFSEMHPLAFGGYVVDTPGIKGFGIINIEKEEIYHFFPELFKVSRGCKYHNCLHYNEPECAVKMALDRGMISRTRYNNYLEMLLDENSKYRTD